MRNAAKWENFDDDVMTEEALILWKISEIMRKDCAVDVAVGTEACNPTQTLERKRKRKPETWLRNKLKKAKNSGKGYGDS